MNTSRLISLERLVFSNLTLIIIIYSLALVINSRSHRPICSLCLLLIRSASHWSMGLGIRFHDFVRFADLVRWDRKLHFISNTIIYYKGEFSSPSHLCSLHRIQRRDGLSMDSLVGRQSLS